MWGNKAPLWQGSLHVYVLSFRIWWGLFQKYVKKRKYVKGKKWEIFIEMHYISINCPQGCWPPAAAGRRQAHIYCTHICAESMLYSTDTVPYINRGASALLYTVPALQIVHTALLLMSTEIRTRNIAVPAIQRNMREYVIIYWITQVP